jgi:protoporphyrin/coproporphyrin ferrochelatase
VSKPPADGASSRYPEAFFDAILVVSFGGPEGPEDVLPFLENVTRGRDVPRERLQEVAHHYELFGGVSPINGQNRALIAALRVELDEHGIELPIYFGNRNWYPLLPDTLREMTADGVERALAFFTSGFSCYSSCRQYRENLHEAQLAAGPNAPEILKTRLFYNHPGFVEANAELVAAVLAEIPEERRLAAHVAFSAHSIPLAMARQSRYESQLAESAGLVAAAAGAAGHRIVYQSRSGPPQVPWLGPEVCDHLRDLAQQGVGDVVVSPIGFVSDHVEVLFDLDVEARAVAEAVGINLLRAPTVGTHPAFVSMIRELIGERLSFEVPRRSLGEHGPSHAVCPPGCCLPGNGRPSPWDTYQAA